MAKNLDDDFDELANSNFDENDENASYSLTPKGILMASLLDSELFCKNFDTNNIDSVMELSTEVWNNFENYCRKHYGSGEKIAAVIFDRNGGITASIRTDDPEASEED